MKEFSVKSNSFPLYKAFREECEKIGWKYNTGFTPFEEGRVTNRISDCLYFADGGWSNGAKGPHFAFSNSNKNTFQLETQYGEALAFAKEQFNYKPKRWRADIGERYYFIQVPGDIDYYDEAGDSTDDGFWVIGNYFQTEEEAENASKKVRELLLSLPGKEAEKKATNGEELYKLYAGKKAKYYETQGIVVGHDSTRLIMAVLVEESRWGWIHPDPGDRIYTNKDNGKGYFYITEKDVIG